MRAQAGSARCVARDLLGVFAAIEFAWLASVGVLALSSDRGALNGASRMFVAGGMSSALFLLGAALVHRGVGGTDLATLPSVHIDAPGLAAAGIGLVLLSVALKAGIAPLNFWIGAAYGRAGRLAVLVLGAIGAVGARCVSWCGSHRLHCLAPAIGEGVSITLATLGAVSVVIGSVQAVGARNVLRLAAYAGGGAGRRGAAVRSTWLAGGVRGGAGADVCNVGGDVGATWRRHVWRGRGGEVRCARRLGPARASGECSDHGGRDQPDGRAADDWLPWPLALGWKRESAPAGGGRRGR